MSDLKDLLIIGGGAAGLASAITAKKENPNLSVTVLEKLDRVGKKLITTGNGRCNISNTDESLARFHGEDTSFAGFALDTFSNEKIKDFFSAIGIEFSEENGKLYPSSFQASSVVDCLRFECARLGVEILCSHTVKEIKKGKIFTVSGEGFQIHTKALIVAAGLFSGGEKLGSDGSVYRLLKDLGHKGVKASPAIVQIKTETDFVKQLKGIKIDALAGLYKENFLVRQEFGEVLFCDYGLSGPPIMQISRNAFRDEGEYYIFLDLFSDKSKAELLTLLENRVQTLKERSLEEFFTGLLNKRLGQVVLKYCGFKLSQEVCSLDKKDIEKIADALKSFKFKVLGHTGFVNSQVTAGGLATSLFDSKTMMSKIIPGLFAAGEILDIDGDCGGFNLKWAWSSGILAAKSAVGYIK